MIVLAANEKILKTYNYCTADQTNHSLTVTSKRVISTREYKEKKETARSQKEVFLKDISAVSGAYAHKSSIKWLILLLLGIAFIAVGLLGCLDVIPTGQAAMQAIFFAPLGLGVVLLICGFAAFKNRKVTSMTLVLLISQEYNEALALSCSSINRKAKRKKTEDESSVSVEVDEKIADELISEIGAFVAAVK